MPGLAGEVMQRSHQSEKLDLPEILSLLPRIDNLLPRQSLLEFGRGSTDFTKYVFVMLSVHHTQRLSHEMLV